MSIFDVNKIFIEGKDTRGTSQRLALSNLKVKKKKRKSDLFKFSTAIPFLLKWLDTTGRSFYDLNIEPKNQSLRSHRLAYRCFIKVVVSIRLWSRLN